jgi:two-component system cell cycle sensor histidine kinase/response regulator CckA
MDEMPRMPDSPGDSTILLSRLRELKGETFFSLVENSTDLIGIATLDGDLFYLNPAGRKMLGLDDTPIPEGVRVQDFISDKHRARFQYGVQCLLRAGNWTGEARARHFRTGASIPLETRAFLVRDPGDGTPIAMASISRDISDRKRVEKALRLSEEKFEKAFRISPDAVNINRVRDGLFVEINDGFTRLTGYEVEDVIGKTSLDLDVWARAEDRAELLRRIEKDGEALNFEAKFRKKDGRIDTGLMSARIIEMGGEKFLLTITRDISERIRLEDRLRQAQKMEAVGRLAGGIAHDFNNLLTVIIGYCDVLLSRGNLEDRAAAEVHEVRKAGETASSLTSQLLAFGRKQVLNLQPMALNDLLSNIENMLRRMIGETIELTSSVEPHLWTIRADVNQLQQVVMNLAINARDAMKGGGTLTIRTWNALVEEDAPARPPDCPPGPYVVLAVSDTGHGMDEATSREIFEPFFTTREPGQGSGLGLSTVHGIVRQSGGFIEVETKPGRGSTFKVFLPGVEIPAEPAARGVDDEVRGGSETVLLVEDSDVVRCYTAEILQMGGYAILEAASGEEAIRIAKERGRPIDILVTDLVMPGVNGKEVAARLGAAQPGLKVLFVSGYPEDAVGKKRLIEDGAPFLGKPFKPNDLLRKIREILDA